MHKIQLLHTKMYENLTLWTLQWLLSGHRSTCSITVKEGGCTSWLSAFSNIGEHSARGSTIVVWERVHEACTDCMLGSVVRVGRSVLAMVPTQASHVAWCMHQLTLSGMLRLQQALIVQLVLRVNWWQVL